MLMTIMATNTTMETTTRCSCYLHIMETNTRWSCYLHIMETNTRWRCYLHTMETNTRCSCYLHTMETNARRSCYLPTICSKYFYIYTSVKFLVTSTNIRHLGTEVTKTWLYFIADRFCRWTVRQGYAEQRHCKYTDR